MYVCKRRHKIGLKLYLSLILAKPPVDLCCPFDILEIKLRVEAEYRAAGEVHISIIELFIEDPNNKHIQGQHPLIPRRPRHLCTANAGAGLEDDRILTNGVWTVELRTRGSPKFPQSQLKAPTI